MRQHKRFWAVLLGATLITGLVPGVALAAAGDDFGEATEIATLPFRTTIDTTGATKADDDPLACDASGDGSVWLRYTAPAAGIVRLAVRSGGKTPLFSVFTGERGALTPLPGMCSYFSPYEDTFHVEAGTTYHVLVVDRSVADAGPVQVGLTAMSPAPNDDRAAARVLAGLPARLEFDTRRATAEPGEAPPSCDPTAVRSLWYRYPATRTQFVSVDAGWAAITVHRDGDTAELDCVPTSTDEQAVFHAVEGENYLIRVVDRPQKAERYLLDVGQASAITSAITPSPHHQPVGAEFEFNQWAGDPVHSRPLVSGTVTFGDGSSAPALPSRRILHRYAQAGVYDVKMTVSTRDGRTGTASTRVVVG